MPQKKTDKQIILHLIDTTGPGGAEDVFIRLAGHFNDQNTRSVAVIRGEGYVAKELRNIGVEPIIIDSKGSFNVGFLVRLARIIYRQKVDVIQSHLLGSNVYAAIVGMFTRTPVVATYHGMVDVSPTERFKRLKLWFMRKGISCFVAVSNSLAKKIATQNLLIPERTKVIYNGVDTTLYGQRKHSELRQRLGINDDAVLFGTLGNIRKSKRYDLLLEAINDLGSLQHKFHVVIAGDPKSKLQLELDAFIAKHNIKNVSFIGFVEDTPEYLNGLDVFLLTSDAEGFSISTIEALATGLPVIATRCGGPEEIIEDVTQGTLIDVEHHAISSAISDIINNVPESLESNAHAIERATSAFSSATMVKAYGDLYNELKMKGV